MRVLVDTDAGVDDALALMLLLAAPEVEVAAVTAVDGNVPLARVVENVLEVAARMDARVPVYPGAAAPLLPEPRERADFFHGADGLGNLKARVARGRAKPTPAALAIVELARRHPGELVVVALGPLTNLATALVLDPELPVRIRRLVVMGGAHTGRGNTQTPTAEFNFRADPEAAAKVLAAFPRVALVTWETTLAHPLPWPVHRRLKRLGTPRAAFYAAITGVTEAYLRERGHPGLLVPDPLAALVALEPEAATGVERHAGAVETCGRLSRGQLVLDRRPGKRGENLEVVTELDLSRLVARLEAALSG